MGLRKSFFTFLTMSFSLASAFPEEPAAKAPTRQEAPASQPAGVVNSNWNGGVGNWSTSTGWTPNGAPNNGGGNTYNVTIGTASDQVTLDLSPTITSLILGNGTGASTLQQLSGAHQTLTINGTFTENKNANFYLGNGDTLSVGGAGSNAGYIDFYGLSTGNFTGDFTNTGRIETNGNNGSSANSLTFSGAFNNNAGAWLNIGVYNDTADVVNMKTLTNNGRLSIGTLATLNLTGQPNGVTDIVSGSEIDLYGTFKAGAVSALAKLASIEGYLYIENGQSTTFTPGSGTLALAAGSYTDIEKATSITISGNVNSTGRIETNGNNTVAGTNHLTVNGTYTNNVGGGWLNIGVYNDATDIVNIGTLVNNGRVTIGTGSTLNLTSQPNGITDVVAGSEFDVYGTFTAGAANALAKLASVEGYLYIENGTSTTITPGGGTLTLGSGSYTDVERASSVTVSGNVSSTGRMDTNGNNSVIGANHLTVTGTYTTNPGGWLNIGAYNDSADVVNVATLVNNGRVSIGTGATLNLTNQPNGLTDVVQGSELDLLGTFKAGAANALAKLASVEGYLYIENGASTNITPGGGTLTLASGSYGDVEKGSTVTVSGNVSNTGHVDTNGNNSATGVNQLNVTGTFTNNAGGWLNIGAYGDTPDVVNVATLVNNGRVTVGADATLNLTSQPNGITDVATGSEIDLYGAIKAGAANGLAKLGSVEGYLYIENGKSTSITPGSGSLTTGSGSYIDVEKVSTVTISGGVNNSGRWDTNGNNSATGVNTVTVNGAFTNNASGFLNIGVYNDTADVFNVKTLTNNGRITIGNLATLNLTNQPGGLTSMAAGSEIDLYGAFKAGAADALAKLATLSGRLNEENAVSNTITPGGGKLTVASSGLLDVERGATLTVSGSVANSGQIYTNANNTPGGVNTLTVTGTLTNNSTGLVDVGVNNDSHDILNAGVLSNAGTVTVQTGATLNLSSSGTGSNTGTVSLNASTLKISGANVTLNGAGKITLSNLATNLITGSAPANIFTSANTIQGSGTISNMGIVNTGTISANQSTPLLILPSAAGLNNQGTLSVTAGDNMQVGTSAGGALLNFAGTTLTGGTYSVGGTLQFGASGTNVVTNAANISLTGAGAQIIDFGSHNVLTNLATITGAGSLTLGTSYGTFTTAGNFTNNGTLTVGAGDKFAVNPANSLTNFSGTTLTGGTYKITGTLQFAGANIVTDAAKIQLSGANSKILSSTGANGLANLATITAAGSLSLSSSRNFTTAGNFTNNGALTVGTGTNFTVNGNLTNFSGTTLTGGVYSVGGTLQFNGANVVTNAANVSLTSSTAKIISNSSANAFTNFANNSGTFAISGGAILGTSGGNFTNSGTFTVSANSTFSVGGSSFNFTQTAGTTTVDGSLTNSSNGTLNLNGGSLFGIGSVGYNLVDGATLSPGDTAAGTGAMAVTHTYTQNSAGALNVTIGGTTAGTQYDQLNVTSSASLNGKLNITLASGFTPTVGSTFTILNASSVSGTFATITGLSINSTEHFAITYNANDVILTVASGAAQTPSALYSRLVHRGLGMPGRVSVGHITGQHYGLAVYQPANAFAMRPRTSPATPQSSAAPPRLTFAGSVHPRDFAGLAAVAPVESAFTSPAGPSLQLPLGVAASSLNAMSSMNHQRFEVGVDMKALLKTSPRRLLKSLWAAPDSPDALAIGYMLMTTAR